MGRRLRGTTQIAPKRRRSLFLNAENAAARCSGSQGWLTGFSVSAVPAAKPRGALSGSLTSVSFPSANIPVFCCYFLHIIYFRRRIVKASEHIRKAAAAFGQPVSFLRIISRIARSLRDTCTWVIPSFSAVACWVLLLR